MPRRSLASPAGAVPHAVGCVATRASSDHGLARGRWDGPV